MIWLEAILLVLSAGFYFLSLHLLKKAEKIQKTNQK